MPKASLALVLCGIALAALAPGSSAQTRSGGGLKLKTPAEIGQERQVRPGDRSSVPPPPDVAAAPADAERTASGLATRVLRAGTGSTRPRPIDWVGVLYTGWTTDGRTVDTTTLKAKPNWFAVSSAIPGFAEALGLMVEGEARRIWIPEQLAYANQPGRPRGMLVFDLELAGIRVSPAPPADLAAPPSGAVRAESGLVYRVLSEGAGERPGPDDTAVVAFTVWRTDGSVVDSSVLRGEPFAFNLDATLLGFREALTDMAVGERRRLWLDEPRMRLPGKDVAEVPGGAVVDLELLEFQRRPVPPEHLFAPDPEAERTLSGLATKVLRAGSGERKPRAGDRVRVNYAGWTRDGQMFDSSWERGEPGLFPLDATMPAGWNEALKLMVAGERRMIWIPEDLAKSGRPDRPQGMLIFDVELLEIVEAPASP